MKAEEIRRFVTMRSEVTGGRGAAGEWRGWKSRCQDQGLDGELRSCRPRCACPWGVGLWPVQDRPCLSSMIFHGTVLAALTDGGLTWFGISCVSEWDGELPKDQMDLLLRADTEFHFYTSQLAAPQWGGRRVACASHFNSFKSPNAWAFTAVMNFLCDLSKPSRILHSLWCVNIFKWNIILENFLVLVPLTWREHCPELTHGMLWAISVLYLKSQAPEVWCYPLSLKSGHCCCRMSLYGSYLPRKSSFINISWWIIFAQIGVLSCWLILVSGIR